MKTFDDYIVYIYLYSRSFEYILLKVSVSFVAVRWRCRFSFFHLYRNFIYWVYRLNQWPSIAILIIFYMMQIHQIHDDTWLANYSSVDMSQHMFELKKTRTKFGLGTLKLRWKKNHRDCSKLFLNIFIGYSECVDLFIHTEIAAISSLRFEIWC